MCDGSKVEQGGLVLCTPRQSFTLEEVRLLMKVLESNFGLVCTYQTITRAATVCYRLYIKAESMSKLNSLVRPHMIPSMLYELHN